MTDDIVTRLRGWSIDLYPAPYGACMEQAAEEIEYLQTELAKWKALAIENDNIAQIQAGIYPPIPHYVEELF